MTKSICPVCGANAYVQGYNIGGRSSYVEGVPPAEVHVRGCAECVREARRQLNQSNADEIVDGGVSRRAAVTAAFFPAIP